MTTLRNTLIQLFIIIGIIYANDSQSELLNLAYQDNSIEKLTDFCEKWYKEYSNNNYEKKEKEKEYYDVFNEFYNPYIPKRYCNLTCTEMQTDTFYRRYNYLIIQGKLDVIILGKKKKDVKKIFIKEFRPNIQLENKKCLILTQKYETILYSFLCLVSRIYGYIPVKEGSQACDIRRISVFHIDENHTIF